MAFTSRTDGFAAMRNSVIFPHLSIQSTQLKAELLRRGGDPAVPQRLPGFQKLSGRALPFAALFYLCILVDFDVI